MNNAMDRLPLAGENVPNGLSAEPRHAQAVGAAVMKAFTSPWVRKPAYFVLAVGAVALGFARVLAEAIFVDADDGGDENLGNFLKRMDAEAERTKLPPSALGVGIDPDANKEYPGLYAQFIDKQNQINRDRAGY